MRQQPLSKNYNNNSNNSSNTFYESSHLFYFLHLLKRDSCPRALSTPTNPLTNIRELIVVNNINNNFTSSSSTTTIANPIILKISPSLWRRYFLIQDAFNLKKELWGFTRDKEELIDKYGMNEQFIKIDFFEKLEILDIISGAYFTFFITKNDGIYGIGENDNGQLGIGNTITQLDFVKINALNDLKIKKIQAGNYFTMVLTEDSEVYGFGQNNWGQTGTGLVSDSILVPTKLDMFGKASESESDDEKIGLETIYCGHHNTFFLTTESEKTNNLKHLYGCGYVEFGQLGPQVDSKLISINTPILIEFFSKEKAMTVKTMSSSYGFSFVLTMSNEVYSFGTQDYGELGIGSNENTIFGFTKVNFNLPIGDVIQHVSCGTWHTVCISKTGKIFHTGSMPVYKNSTYSDLQINYIPFEAFSFLSTDCVAEVFTCANESYIVVNKILSTSLQLLGRLRSNNHFQKLMDGHLLTDIQIFFK